MFTNFRSARIPTRNGLQLWCIDQIDRADFFEVTTDECLLMPGREHVPDYTVVHMINSRIDLERLERIVRECAPGTSQREWQCDYETQLAQLGQRYTAGTRRGWEQVQAVVAGLRREFTLDRRASEHRPAEPRNAESALAFFSTREVDPIICSQLPRP